ncbi:hypothetical protein EAH79_02765 [Sphingomonas koreensis]|nr:hypothetical protein EAH79_02765 [Sphingomonas koreensis]
MKRRVAFLFLGETLLIPHLYPIVEALAAADPALPIELWVSTSVHEVLIGGWLAATPFANVRVRRAPGFRALRGHEDGRNPPLPAKLPMLARLAPRLARTPVVVCAEQTSLWLPTLLPLPSRFIKTPHGAGSLMRRKDRRRRAAWRTLVAAPGERAALAAVGVDPARIAVTGYVKAAFRQRADRAALFAEARPIILYNPHWRQHRSSWWRWGGEVIQRIVQSGRYNLIFAPHQRLIEGAPRLRAIVADLADRHDVLCDLDSFAMVDGSYTAAADLYLGDTSSQIVEFLMRPRPCVFLDAQGVDWRRDPAYAMWENGAVVSDLDALIPALDAAPALQPALADRQAAFAERQLGPLDGQAPARAAAEILAALPGAR